MAYVDHYKLADDVIAHLDTVISGITDPFLVSRYTGFVAVTCVTVYELAVKEIFIEFAEKKHKVLGEVIRKNFERINGRIKTETLRKEYVGSFGNKYVQKFTKKLNLVEMVNLRDYGVSVLSSYGNIVTWRHLFAHEGQLPSQATYAETTKSYRIGKEVIKCLAETMRR